MGRRYKKHQLSWGRILNVDTEPAQEFVGQLAYGTSKASIEAATRAIVHEIGPLGITINADAPGALFRRENDQDTPRGSAWGRITR